ncbi:winged helix-turn-helix domain-containing protein [Croceimicrobium hydrocarbonivorans]|uniref:Winged helix-turn-helix transcriptional regulator n=1 Tax=Croceimicrobium hydrocarbonivorans TaxID=2761580 RepID=A0A7H0VFZ0_9FLAO|nr:winged helix-turn-helix domain-containing protein [Croceimicrobium hydrocarbonivorans]QNR24638.1 winged helix-turn-helix transcriptional regulator [Croceimicrobium hydrocarbonivorans]
MQLRLFHTILGLFFSILLSAKGEAAHYQVAVRQMGHHILSDFGDINSRVMPVEQEGDLFILKFEKPFSFEPLRLVDRIEETVIQAKLSEYYQVALINEATGEVVYSFEHSPDSLSNIIPCLGRDQPTAKYRLQIRFPDFQEEESAEFPLWLMAIFIVGPIVLLLMYPRKKNIEAEPLSEDSIQLGAYTYSPTKAQLSFKDQKQELTGKEGELLLRLYQDINQTVKREDLLEAVWGDEGDYVGRTLDVFISRLRKKLEEDPSVKIVNIRGVGYKLIS